MEAPNYLLSSLLILGASSIGFLLYSIRNKKKSSSSSSSGKFSVTELLKNKDRILDWSTEVLSAVPNNTVSIDFMNMNVVLTTNPSNLEHVLKTNFQNYIKGPSTIGTFEDLLGHGILNSDGEHWQLQRKLVGQEFATKNFRNFAMDTVFSEIVNRLLPLLSDLCKKNSPASLDLQEVFERFSFDNFCKITFGVDPGRLTREDSEEDYEELLRSFESSARLVTRRYGQPKFFRKVASFLGLGIESKLNGDLAILNAYIMKVIKEKKKGTGTGSDLISRLLTQGDFSNVFLRDMMINLMGAGRDTTASGMAWFFWLVSSKPEVQLKIIEEIKSVREKHGSNAGEAFTLDELREMNYLHAAVSESLRLYPPVPVDARIAIGADVLPDGTKVSKGTSITHSAYVLGRIESIWGKNCKEFVPERFLDNGVFQPKNPYQYVVFHAGPRMCPGKEMAYNQIKAVVASIMEKFVVEMAEEGEREQENVFALRMRKGLPVLIRAR